MVSSTLKKIITASGPIAVGAWKFSYLFPEKKRVTTLIPKGSDGTGSTSASEASFATPTVEELLTRKIVHGKIVHEHFAKTEKDFFRENRKFEDFFTVTESKLGTGVNGGVMEVNKKVDPTRAKFALKKLVKKEKPDLRFHRAEVNTYLHLATTTPNYTDYFPRLEAIFEDDEAVWIVMEKCAGGDLFHALKQENHSDIPYKWRKGVSDKVEKNVDKLHELGIMHRDIKPENFLFCPATMTGESYTPEAGDLRLMDFGFAAPSSATLTDSPGTPSYVAPELVENAMMEENADKRRYGVEVDKWSMWITQCVVLAASFPFDRKLLKSMNGIENRIKFFDALRDGTALEFPPWIRPKYDQETVKDYENILGKLKQHSTNHIERRAPTSLLERLFGISWSYLFCCY